MTTTNSPYQTKPPEKKRLFIATLIAFITALLILLFFILPAEYGIDFTGTGNLLGLNKLQGDVTEPEFTNKSTMDINNQATDNSIQSGVTGELSLPTPLPNPDVLQIKKSPWKNEVITINLAQGESLEYKAIMLESQVMLYHWSVDKGLAYFDFHADSPRASKDFWVRYQEGNSVEEQGSLVAPFYGNHGWFWQNKNNHPITITLTVEGYYSLIKKL